MSRISNSPEAQALQGQFDRLMGGIQDPAEVADSAFSRGLIPQAVHEEVTDPAMGPRMKRNRILLLAVLSHVQEEPSGFEVFLGILRQEQAYEHLAKKLESSLRHCKRDVAVHMPPSNTAHSGKYMFIGTVVVMLIITLLVSVRFVGNISNSGIHYQESVSRPEARYPIDSKCNSSIAVETDLPALNPDVPFVGREEELAEMSSFLRSDTVYVIGINGPPAFGKSTLAIHVGWDVVKAGIMVRYVDASERKLFKQSSKPCRHSESASTSAVQSPADHLQIYSDGQRNEDDVCEDGNTCSDLLQWAGTLDAYKHVLILDNCDGVLTGAQKDKFYHMIDMLFQKSAYRYLSVVITSQTKVRFVKQRTELYYISDLSEQASLQLLRSSVPEWQNITQEDGEEIADLVGNCPLALQIVCGAIRESSSVTGVISKLKQNTLKTISPKHLGDKDRFEMVMNVAYTYLPSETKDCVHCIGAFPGSFDENAGVTILENCELGGQDCLETLESRSLIERYWLGTEYRYRLHRLIREYFRLNTSECSDFSSSFRKHYALTFRNLLHNNTQHVDVLEHKLDMEYPNFKYLIIILCSVPNDELQGNDFAMLAYAYIHHSMPTRCASHCVSPATMLNALANHKHTIETILPQAMYHSLYADFLLFANDQCRSKIYDQCKCMELCKYAISMWFLPHTHIQFGSKTFWRVCTLCPMSLMSAYFGDVFYLIIIPVVMIIIETWLCAITLPAALAVGRPTIAKVLCVLLCFITINLTFALLFFYGLLVVTLPIMDVL